jgi:hypothetical protein
LEDDEKNGSHPEEDDPEQVFLDEVGMECASRRHANDADRVGVSKAMQSGEMHDHCTGNDEGHRVMEGHEEPQ